MEQSYLAFSGLTFSTGSRGPSTDLSLSLFQRDSLFSAETRNFVARLDGYL